jgi:hypothetical protein
LSISATTVLLLNPSSTVAATASFESAPQCRPTSRRMAMTASASSPNGNPAMAVTSRGLSASTRSIRRSATTPPFRQQAPSPTHQTNRRLDQPIHRYTKHPSLNVDPACIKVVATLRGCRYRAIEMVGRLGHLENVGHRTPRATKRHARSRFAAGPVRY